MAINSRTRTFGLYAQHLMMRDALEATRSIEHDLSFYPDCMLPTLKHYMALATDVLLDEISYIKEYIDKTVRELVKETGRYERTVRLRDACDEITNDSPVRPDSLNLSSRREIFVKILEEAHHRRKALLWKLYDGDRELGSRSSKSYVACMIMARREGGFENPGVLECDYNDDVKPYTKRHPEFETILV